LAALLEMVRNAHRAASGTTEDLLVGLQLTHSGRFARPNESGPSPKIAYHHPILERKYTAAAAATPLTDRELEAIGENFVEAARLAQGVGFDFVDVKCCHGYLLHELLSARTRDGKYGGSFENRTRLFVRIVEDIRTACAGLMIATRVSITDIFPFSKDPQTGVGAPLGLKVTINEATLKILGIRLQKEAARAEYMGETMEPSGFTRPLSNDELRPIFGVDSNDTVTKLCRELESQGKAKKLGRRWRIAVSEMPRWTPEV
ncbi:unnamed protein product, partial [marine sediment metagenome]